MAIEAARTGLDRAWKSYRSASRSPAAEARWQKDVTTFRREVEVLNHRIFSFNLNAPNSQVHRATLSFEREMERIAWESAVVS